MDSPSRGKRTACDDPPCVAVADSCNASSPLPSQRWRLAPVSPAEGGAAATWHIVHAADQLCLTATSAAAHASLRLTACSSVPSAAAAASQAWTLLAQGHIMLANNHSCCADAYVAPSSLGHFRGQDHVAFKTHDGVPQGPAQHPRRALLCAAPTLNATG